MLVRAGIILIKYWFSVSDAEQERRFQSRLTDPIRRWKLSPMDLESRTKWVEYSRAKDEMFLHTDIAEAPWWVVEADSKKRARLSCIHHLLSAIPLRGPDAPAARLAAAAGGDGLRPSLPDRTALRAGGVLTAL